MATQEYLGLKVKKVTKLYLILVRFMHFMYSKIQLKKEQKVIKISKFISLQRSPGFGAVAKMAGFGAIQGKVLTCLWAETWDNPVCRNGTSVDQGTSSGVTAKCICCCSLHLLAPKQAFRPAERSAAKAKAQLIHSWPVCAYSASCTFRSPQI